MENSFAMPIGGKMVLRSTGEEVEIIQESKIDSIIPKGTSVYLGVKTEKINVFNEDGSRNIVTGVKNDLDIYRKG